MKKNITHNKKKDKKETFTKKNKKLIKSDLLRLINDNINDQIEIMDDVDLCSKCKTILIYSDEGFMACSNKECSILYNDILDHGAEWRFYGNDDNNNSDPNRVGMPINEMLEESSFGCKIVGYGSYFNSHEIRKIRKYSEWHSVPYKEKSQYDQFQKIRTIANNANIPANIVDDAIKYHKKISEYNQTFRGDNRDGLIAASMYMSCRTNKYPKTPKELAEIFNLNSSSATKGRKTAFLIMNQIENNIAEEEKTVFSKTKPHDFIERYCSALNICQELIHLAMIICDIIETYKLLPENSPNSSCVGIIYYICQKCNLNISKKDISNIASISEVTINKCYKKLTMIDKNLLIPTELQTKYCIID